MVSMANWPSQTTDGPIAPKWLQILIFTQLLSAAFAKSENIRCVEQPAKTITETIYSEVYLVCAFNTKVNCKWSKDGVEVTDIGTESNRRWMRGNGRRTDDCTLLIRHLNVADEGSWVCSGSANGNFNQVSSRPSRIYIDPRIVVHPDEEIIQGMNNEVYLVCKFSAIVNCKWRKDDVEVTDIGPQFNHRWMDGNGENTKDCSLIISQLSAADEGSWVCSSMANGHFDEVSSKSSRIYVDPISKSKIHMTKIVKQPDEETVQAEDSTVNLICTFNTQGSCKWSKDGVEVTGIGRWSNRRWKTGVGENTRDCSLVIVSLSDDDEGSWVCSGRANGHIKEVSSRPTRLYIELSSPIFPAEPLIYYGNQVLNGVNKRYPGKRAMAALYCDYPNFYVDKKITLRWVLVGEGIYEEQVKGLSLNLGPKLIEVIEEKLQRDSTVLLICEAKHKLRHVASAKVAFFSDPIKRKIITPEPSTTYHHGASPERPQPHYYAYDNLLSVIWPIMLTILICVFCISCLSQM